MQGKWLGEWSGRWFGDGDESSGSFSDMSATLSGSGGLSATLSGDGDEVYYLAPVVRLRPKPRRIEEDEALLIALLM